MSGPCTDCGGPDYQTLEAELAEANATIDAMDSWAGMMEQARKHYPQDVAYFAQSNDPGCRIVRGLHAIDAERQHAEQAEAKLAERDRMLAEVWYEGHYPEPLDVWLDELRVEEKGRDE